MGTAYKALWKDRDEQEHLRAEYFRRLMAAEKRVAQLQEDLADIAGVIKGLQEMREGKCRPLDEVEAELAASESAKLAEVAREPLIDFGPIYEESKDGALIVCKETQSKVADFEAAEKQIKELSEALESRSDSVNRK